VLLTEVVVGGCCGCGCEAVAVALLLEDSAFETLPDTGICVMFICQHKLN